MPLPYSFLYRIGITPWHRNHIDSHISDCLQEFQPPTPRYALDLGCGRGTETRYLAANNWIVTAVEAVPRAIHQAKESAGDMQHEPTWIVSNVFETSNYTKGPPFDFILDKGCLFSYSIAKQAKLNGLLATSAGEHARYLRFGLFRPSLLERSVGPSWKCLNVVSIKRHFHLPNDAVPTWSLWEKQ